jgi:hypothetical protein
MRLIHLTTLVAALLALSACQQKSSPSASASSDKGADEAQVIAATSSPVISVDPATMKGCDAIVASVKWDVSKAGVSTNSTEIWVGSSVTDTKLFGAGGAQGAMQTGAWTLPGMHFVLKNRENGKVIAEAIVGGPKCH